MQNPKLFPDSFAIQLSDAELQPEETSITLLQQEQFRDSLKDIYAARLGLTGAIRAENRSVEVINKILPTERVGQNYASYPPPEATHGFFYGGLWGSSWYNSPELTSRIEFKFDFASESITQINRDALSDFSSESLLFDAFMPYGVTFGNSAIGFFRQYSFFHNADGTNDPEEFVFGSVRGISFDSEMVVAIAASAISSFTRSYETGLKGRVNGYAVGGADYYQRELLGWRNATRFNYDSLVETTLGSDVEESGFSAFEQAVSWGDKNYGYVAGGFSHSQSSPYNLRTVKSQIRSRTVVSKKIYKFNYRLEVLESFSTLLNSGRGAVAGGGWTIGTSQTAYIAQGQDYRNFPTGGDPQVKIINNTTEKFELGTETLSVIGATVAEPRIDAAHLSSNSKGYLLGGAITQYSGQPTSDWLTRSVYNNTSVTNTVSVLDFGTETYSLLGAALAYELKGAESVDNQVR